MKDVWQIIGMWRAKMRTSCENQLWGITATMHTYLKLFCHDVFSQSLICYYLNCASPCMPLHWQSSSSLLCQAVAGPLWKDFGLVLYCSVRMEEKYLYLPDWCLIHQFKTVALLTLDCGGWRLLRVYDPSLTLSGDILLLCVHLCACVGVTIVWERL